MDKIYEQAKVVIIDDVEQVLNSNRRRLEFEGMNVTCFSNPEQGLEYLKENKDDVLLLDFFMPQMNGDEFVEKLREYNGETIVILQTGYSDKIPPLAMIDKMNIQGYLDKLKGEDELVLMTKAAIKTSFLNKALREKDREIAKLSFKKSILGDLISHLINESKDQLFSISSMNEAIMQDSEDFSEETRIIKTSIEKVASLYEALNFEENKSINMKQFANTIKELLKAKLLLNNAKLVFDIKDETAIIENDADELIYITLKAIDILIKESAKDITIKTNENKVIEVQCDSISENIDIEELKILNSNVKISKKEKSIIIQL